MQCLSMKYDRPTKLIPLNRPGIFGGSNFDVDWSHDEQDNEQVQP